MVSIDLAAAILQRGKQLAPDRFPKPDPGTAEAWAHALNRNYPPALWEDAVFLWATSLVGERMCTPRELLEAAKHVVRRWEVDASKRDVLEAYRHQALTENYKRILGPGFEPHKVPPPPEERKALEAPRGPVDFGELKKRLRAKRLEAQDAAQDATQSTNTPSPAQSPQTTPQSPQKRKQAPF